MSQTTQLRALDMFSGAGGSSTGARSAGVQVVAAFDHWEPAKKVYKANFPDTKFYDGDITAHDPAQLKNEIGEIDLIIASPDCTSHSIAKGNASRSDESKNTAFQVARFASVFKPQWIVIENVERIGAWERYDEFIKGLQGIGYTVSANNLLDASNFRVPQARKRRFVICSLAQLEVKITPPRKAKPRSAHRIIEKNGKYEYTALQKDGRADATLSKANKAIEKLGKKIPFLIVYYGSGKKGNGGWQNVSEPLRTITTLDRFAYVRPTKSGHEMRMLQPEELKLAMGFPKKFKLEEVEGINRRDRIKLMGNAVCPPVMEQILKKILEAQTGLARVDELSRGLVEKE